MNMVIGGFIGFFVFLLFWLAMVFLLVPWVYGPYAKITANGNTFIAMLAFIAIGIAIGYFFQ